MENEVGCVAPLRKFLHATCAKFKLKDLFAVEKATFKRARAQYTLIVHVMVVYCLDRIVTRVFYTDDRLRRAAIYTDSESQSRRSTRVFSAQFP